MLPVLVMTGWNWFHQDAGSYLGIASVFTIILYSKASWPKKIVIIYSIYIFVTQKSEQKKWKQEKT